MLNWIVNLPEPSVNSPVHLLCRFLQLQDTLSFRFCRCRTLTGSCRAAPAAMDPGMRRICAARRMNATPTSASVWRSTSWRCPRPGPAASAPPPRPCSVGIPFLYATPRATKPGSCWRSASRGRWVQTLVRVWGGLFSVCVSCYTANCSSWFTPLLIVQTFYTG